MSDLFKNFGFTSGGIKNVSPHEALQLCMNGAVLLDVRHEELVAFKHFGVENYILLPSFDIDKHLDELIPDLYYVVADSVGIHSKEVCKLLLEKGFRHVANLAGGMVEWERDGLPVDVDVKERLSGSCTCQLKKREKG
ncbi:MAG: rhodanese-like domain-containing protein [Bacteroidales bacterium]|nr:rhodanese-like domain-containing protein [Bacteroidales bacterium]